MVVSIISPDRYSLVPYCLLSGLIRIGTQAAVDFENDTIDRVEFVMTPASGPAQTQITFDRTFQIPSLYDGGRDVLETVLDYNVAFDLNAVADGAATIVATAYSIGGLSRTLRTFNFTNNSGGTITPKNIYVSQDGDDSTGDGSLATPYATAGKAVGDAVPGDTILIGKGDGSRRNWMAEAWNTGSASGSNDIWISFDAYDDSGSGEGEAFVEWTVPFGTIPRTTTASATPGPAGHDRWRFGPGIKFYEIRISFASNSSCWFDGCEWYTRGTALGNSNSAIASQWRVQFNASEQKIRIVRPNTISIASSSDPTVRNNPANYTPLDVPHALVAGETVDVSGTTSNDGTYTVTEVVGSDIFVEESVTDEFNLDCAVTITAYQLFGVDTGRSPDRDYYLTGCELHHFGEWNEAAKLGRGNVIHDFAGDSPLKSSSRGTMLWYNTRIYNATQGPGNHGDFFQTANDSGAGTNGDIWIQGMRALDAMHAFIQASNTLNRVDGFVLENIVHVNTNSGHYTQSAAYGNIYTNQNWAAAAGFENILISHCTFIFQDMLMDPRNWINARIYNTILTTDFRQIGNQTQTDLDNADLTFYGCVFGSMNGNFALLPGGGATQNRVGPAWTPRFVNDSLSTPRDQRDFSLNPDPNNPGRYFVRPTQLTPPRVSDSGAWASACKGDWRLLDVRSVPRIGATGNSPSPKAPSRKRSTGWRGALK